MSEQRIYENFEVSPDGYSYRCKKCRRPFYSLRSWHAHAKGCLGVDQMPEAQPWPAEQLELGDFREGMVRR
jgi:hypothetical protein